MRLLRSIAHVVAWLALLGIALRPSWRRSLPADEAVLVTPGADAPVVRRLVDSLGAARVFPDPADLPAGGATLRRLHVAGWGLEPEQWSDLEARGFSVVAHPTPLPAGFARVAWSSDPVLGEGLQIEGRTSGLARGTTVSLVDPAGELDSTRVGNDGTFRIDARPSGTGRQLYVLQAGAARETLAVDVRPPPQRRLLILTAAPTFETGALRDWLARRGGAIAIRTAVSRERYRTEFVNRDRVALTPLRDRLLSQFDVVQIDGRSLAGLTAAERAALRRSVTEQGLGVLVIPDTALFDRAMRFSERDFFADFDLRPIGDLEARSIRPTWATLGTASVGPVSSPPYTLADRFGVLALMGDGVGGTAAQVTTRGAGRVGISLVNGSARWLRTGRRDLYSGYWSTLVAAVATGGAPSPTRPLIATAGPWLVHRPVEIGVREPDTVRMVLVRPPSGMVDSVFLASDPLRPDERRGMYWPREIGWHDVGAASFYVQPGTAWWARQAAQRLDAMERHASGRTEAQPVHQTTSVPIPLGWLFGLFVLGAAVVWSGRRPASSLSGTTTGIAS